MKKLVLRVVFVFVSVTGFTQGKTKEVSSIDVLTSVKNTGNTLILNENYNLNKGDQILIYLPASENFLFIKKKSLLNVKLVGKLAGIVETGAVIAFGSSGSINGMTNALNVMNKAQTVQYGANALEKINDLDISKSAKKIAGKKAEVLGWDTTNNILDIKIGRKKYEVSLREAIATNEIKLI